ncbi:MAG TPA: glycerate kinase [Propioniciclava sp.]|jgi:glycerate kinase|uniref:glycerate kinase n=1 Tax=Propioniciclava sp. TaxID=2038686 RepID=UPI002CD24DCA|nr:glycerate kinase [Propioniciclava sp.]HRL47814.1 glycerate kinase [Propioniciclava sp.]HRL79479.1 glycerate kinase [Propioniciclava sp.]
MAPTIVCAPDSFKHALTARDAAAAMAAGVQDAWPGAVALELPLSDGGEGFADALAAALGARLLPVPVLDALGREALGEMAVAGRLAIIEVASAVGLEAVADDERAIWDADTRGVGQLIVAALDAGATELLIGLGGSATNDAGAGMLAALGVRFLDAAGCEVATTPRGLARLARIDATGLETRLAGVTVRVACDVDTPLTGPRGASAVFGPQKGASPDDVPRLDAILAAVADLSGQGSRATDAGAGAAGGLGFALLGFLGASLTPGIALVADLLHLDERVAGADLVLTGEGSVDAQTLAGKAPAGVVDAARRHGVPVVIFAGRVQPEAEALRTDGAVEALVQITPAGQPLAEALAGAGENLRAGVAGYLAGRVRPGGIADDR